MKKVFIAITTSLVTATVFAKTPAAEPVIVSNTFTTTAFSAEPEVDAQCTAVMSAVSQQVQNSHPDMSKRARVISHKLASVLGTKVGTGQAKVMISSQVRRINDLRNGPRPIYEFELNQELNFCVSIAKSYGMM